jgi:hypothetical protein
MRRHYNFGGATGMSRRRESNQAAAVFIALACGAAPGVASAQAGRLGTYSGTLEVSHALPTLTYSAKVQVTMPVTKRDASRIEAEFLAGEAPPAKVLVTRWDTFHRDTSADSGGQFNTLACSLPGPVEIPMSATGVLNVDLRKKTHAFSLALVPMQQLTFNCTHSRSGPGKRKMGVSLMAGTGVPGMQQETQLPFADPGRLAAKYTLVPPGGAKDQGPIVQAWDFKGSQ